MFDWFRDMALEITGNNSYEEELKRKAKHEQERGDKIVFSKSTKCIIYIFGILYLIMGGISLYMSIQIESNMRNSMAGIGAWKYIKYIVLSAIDIAAMICISMKTRKKEIAALVLVIVFVVFMYISSIIIPFL